MNVGRLNFNAVSTEDPEGEDILFLWNVANYLQLHSVNIQETNIDVFTAVSALQIEYVVNLCSFFSVGERVSLPHKTS